VEHSTNQKAVKLWQGDPGDLQAGTDAFREAISRIDQPLFVVAYKGGTRVTHAGTMTWTQEKTPSSEGFPLLAFVPPLPPGQLGDESFKRDLGIKYAYIVGAMANGITSVEMVAAAGRAGMVGFFGSGGLSIDQIDTAIDRLSDHRDEFPYGFNLIHSPNDMRLEMQTAERYVSRGVNLVSASAYLGLTLPLVYYRVKGIHRNRDGRIVCPNRVIAKISRIEVASRFFAPPPQAMLEELVQSGRLEADEAALAGRVPVAQDITAEADSGGHTDNRPALTLLPTILALRDEAMRRYSFEEPLRVGLAGGVATPHAAAAAFGMGAAYILTGSINQAAVEADTSPAVHEMLVQAKQADVTMAPAADMFELGAKVQVLKRGTMFAMRAAKLYELYKTYSRYGDIPAETRTMVERDLLKEGFNDAWDKTRAFFETRDPSQIERAERDERHKMALVFRSYLGQASLWAKTGREDRKIDYQIWCGPSMGAFNAWVRGSFLESADQRRTAVMARHLLIATSRLIRYQHLSHQGVDLPPGALDLRPSAAEAS
jgi:PfaD family protein